MAEKSSFFNSVSGDRKYSAADWASYFAALIGNGTVITPDGQLKVTPAASGVGVKIAAGHAYINGYHYESTGTLSLTSGNGKFQTANGSNPRIDRVVLRWSRANRNIIAAVIAGTPASSPQPPALTRSADVYEIALAQVYVPKGAESLSSANITDLRADDTTKQDGVLVGGFCKWNFADAEGLTSLFEQLTSSFNTWFSTVQAGFNESGPTAELVTSVGNLVNQMAALVGENALPADIPSLSSIQESITDLNTAQSSSFSLTPVWTNTTFGSEAEWDNASAATAFAAQTVKPAGVDFTEYPAVLVEFRLFGAYFDSKKNRTLNAHRRDRVYTLVWAGGQACAHGHHVENTNLPFERHVSYNQSSGVIFGDVFYNKLKANVATAPFYTVTNNKAVKVAANVCLIPMAIYGVQGISHAGV